MVQKSRSNKKKSKPGDNRGFATVSIASKPKTEPTEEETKHPTPAKNDNDNANATTTTTTTEPPAPSTSSSSLPTKTEPIELTEEEKLALLADRIRVPSLKRVHAYFRENPTDQEPSRRARTETTILSPPCLKLSSEIEHEIIKFLKQIDAAETSKTDTSKDAKRKASSLGQLDTNYHILISLGFSETDVRGSMSATGGSDIDKALEWLSLNVPYSRLPLGFADKPYHDPDQEGGTERPENKDSHRTAEIPPEIQHDSKICLEKLEESIKDTLLPAFERVEDKSLPKPTVDTIKQKILAAYENDGEEDEAQKQFDPLFDPNPIHAQFKTELIRLERQLGILKKKTRDTSSSESEYRNCRTRITNLEKHMNFRRRDADFLFFQAMKSFSGNSHGIDETTVSETIDASHTDKLSSKHGNGDLGKTSSGDLTECETSNVDSEDTKDEVEDVVEEEVFSLDIFQDLPNEPTPPITQPPSPADIPEGFRVCEFDVKKWAGKTPKDVLTEFVRKKFPTAKITFLKSPPPNFPSPHNDVHRASVKIFTENSPERVYAPPGSEWCRTWKDAESHASLWALTRLTDLPLYKVLAPVFRDLGMEWQTAKIRSERQLIIDEEVIRLQFFKTLLPEGKGDVCDDDLEGVPVPTDAVSSESEPPPKTLCDSPTPVGMAMKKEYEFRNAAKEHQSLRTQRATLPAFQFRNEIIQRLEQENALIVCGDTGCGKSTQVPQYICEDALLRGFGDRTKVICTQPRRISAMSIAQRVSAEMADPRKGPGSPGSFVGYQIRLETKISKENMLVFCTTGILLRRLESDASLKNTTHVIIDEVHERSIESDLLLILLKRLQVKRPDLRIVLMSATLDADRIGKYFGASVIEIPGRTFPVGSAFLEQVVEMTGYVLERDSEYANRAGRNIRNEGTVQIKFKNGNAKTIQLEWDEEDVTGEEKTGSVSTAAAEDLEKLSKEARRALGRMSETCVNHELIVLLLERIVRGEDSKNAPPDGAILVFLPGMQEIRKLYELIAVNRALSETCAVYPLHSTLAAGSQAEVFGPSPEGMRKVVLATNIAETGITIPDVTVVVNTAKARQVRYDERKRITSLKEVFVSRDSCHQRRGRAGRVRPGFCYHLITRNRYETMLQEHQVPEILRLPLDELCLRLLVCGFKDPVSVLSEEALDAPSLAAVRAAMIELQEIQAVDEKTGDLTPLGRHLSHIPVDLRLGKLLIYGSLLGCLDPMLTVAASLASRSPFVKLFGKEDQVDRERQHFNTANSDLITYANAHSAWRNAMRISSANARRLCDKKYLSYENCLQIETLRVQYLAQLTEADLVPRDPGRDKELSRTGFSFSTSLLHRITPSSSRAGSIPVWTAALVAGMYPRVLLRYPNTGKLFGGPGKPFGFAGIHPSSVNAAKSSLEATTSRWLVYDAMVDTGKLYVRDTTFVSDLAVVLFGGPVTVKHRAKLLLDGDWITFRCHPKTAYILKRVHEEMVEILARNIHDPKRLRTTRDEHLLELVAKLLEDTESNR